jgi:uncharacterized membrane protein YeiB
MSVSAPGCQRLLQIVQHRDAYSALLGRRAAAYRKWICLPYFFNREAGGLAVLSIILLLVKSGMFRAFQSMLAAVGRTALSNYLLTSILCQFLFLWGPWKLYGKLEYYQYNYVVLVVWMIWLRTIEGLHR